MSDLILASGTRDISVSGIAKESQAIRDAAGIPSTETVGYRGTPGLIDATLLTDVEGDVLVDDAGLADFLTAMGATGSGTSGDPYLIKNKTFNNSEGADSAIYLQTTSATYFTFYNCLLSGYDNTCFRISATSAVVLIDQCEFAYDGGTDNPSDVNSLYVSTNGGDATITVTNSKATSGGRMFAKVVGAYTGILTLTDNYLTDETAWTGSITGLIENIATDACTINATYNTTDGSFNGSLGYGLSRIQTDSICTFTATNNDINAFKTYILNVNGATATTAHEITYKYNRARNPAGHSIDIRCCNSALIQYNDFGTSATNHRHIYFNTTGGYTMIDIDVAYNKLDATGRGANSECVYLDSTGDFEVHDNWSVGCSNDAYEFVQPIGTVNNCYNCVGDNTVGQVVDLFEEDGGGTYPVNIYNIYGDGEVGVELTDRISGDTIHSIFVDTTVNTSAIVKLTNNSTAPANISVMSPIWPATLSGDTVSVGTTGVMGANCTFNGIALT